MLKLPALEMVLRRLHPQISKTEPKKSVPSLDFQELLREGHSFDRLDSDSQETVPNYVDLGASGVESVLEIGVSAIALRLVDREDLQLVIKVPVRLVKTEDGTELYATTLDYVSGDRHYSEWIANDADLFRKALDRGYRRLAVKIVDKLFLIQMPGPSEPVKVATNAS
jgi:hypothetical protein